MADPIDVLVMYKGYVYVLEGQAEVVPRKRPFVQVAGSGSSSSDTIAQEEEQEERESVGSKKQKSHIEDVRMSFDDFDFSEIINDEAAGGYEEFLQSLVG